jgi:transposase
MSKAVFKKYAQSQLQLIPPSWDEKIPKAHPVRVINSIIDGLDLSKLYDSYEGGGTSSYHPKMLLKGIIYAYVNNIYSSRRIEEAIKSNIYFIWLCGMNEPDHNTINRFRGVRIAPVLKDVFKQIVLLLEQEGILSLKEQYVDGTKIEANANRYTFVWGRSIKANKERILKQVDELWNYAQSVASEELKDTEPVTFEPVDAEKVRQTIETIENAIKDKQVPKEVKQKINYAKKNYPDKLKQYEIKEQILNGRNSYSKTDPDATFMRMKDDHMGNGQLKAGYNVQISTNNQLITNYTLHPNPTDTLTLAPHIDAFKALYDRMPETLTADSGYGSHENYQLLESNNVTAFVKYNHFHQELHGLRQKKHPFSSDQLYYNAEDDYYVCPMGQHMQKTGTYCKESDSGLTQVITRYTAQNCKECPLHGTCHDSSGTRVIEINHELNRYRKQARDLLTSEEGVRHRKQRPQEVESVFGNIKQNKHFTRFMLRGTKKVTTEFGLIAISHNLKKASTR